MTDRLGTAGNLNENMHEYGVRIIIKYRPTLGYYSPQVL